VSWRCFLIRSIRIGPNVTRKLNELAHAEYRPDAGESAVRRADSLRPACRSPAVAGKKRCRMHGGAKGPGAPLGNKNAFKHGGYTREALERRAQMCASSEARECSKSLGKALRFYLVGRLSLSDAHRGTEI